MSATITQAITAQDAPQQTVTTPERPEKSRQDERYFSHLYALVRQVRTREINEGRTFTMEEVRRDLLEPWRREHAAAQDLERLERDFWRAYQKYAAVPPSYRYLLTWEAAARQPVPQVAMTYRSPRMRQGVLWLQELQRINGEQDFPVSGKVMADIVGYATHTTGYTLLMRLVDDRIIEVTEHGRWWDRRANRYRYVPPLEPVRAIEADERVTGGAA